MQDPGQMNGQEEWVRSSAVGKESQRPFAGGTYRCKRLGNSWLGTITSRCVEAKARGRTSQPAEMHDAARQCTDEDEVQLALQHGVESRQSKTS